MSSSSRIVFALLACSAVIHCSVVNAPEDATPAGGNSSGVGAQGGEGALGGSAGSTATGGSGANQTGGGQTGGSGGGGGCGPVNTLENCGACGVLCEPMNADGPTCETESCAYEQCFATHLDCDLDAANGCEINWETTLEHCGGCDLPCQPLNVANPICNAGACDYDVCAGLADDCDGDRVNGCEAPLDTVDDCGGCGVPCLPANVDVPNCGGGSCGYDNCQGNWSECNGDTADGCESCGADCLPCAGYNCVAQGCEITDNGTVGYGHHGACSGWNGCGDAATCAFWACQYRGFETVASHDSGVVNTGQFTASHLFNDQNNLDENWSSSSCGLNLVSNIVCKNCDCQPGHNCVPYGCDITSNGTIGYGHHGACSGWNGCGDAATCALWACQYRGYNNVVSHDNGVVNSGQFAASHLFNDQNSLDENWNSSSCGLNLVSNIICSM